MGLAGLAYRAFFGRKGPVVSGDLSIAGPEKPIRIRRDRWAVPHIEAAGERDAWFGLGFCQGQDRALQLELLMRVGRGTLSELVGREGLIIDRLCRRIGFSRAAKAQLSVLDPAIRANLEAFAAGVNSGRTAGLPASSSDFQLLRSRPSSFFPEDCLSVMGLMSFSLASNWDAELMRLKVLEADGSEALAALGGGYPHDLPVSIPPGALAGRALNRMAAELRALREATGFSGSSNNWALSPGRTASGRPILANDPHLPPDIPSQWYLAHRMTTGWAAAGAAFVGGPAIAIGHNGCSAWGVTAGFVDNTDLFLEEVGPDGKSVRGADGFVPCEVRRERISVRGGKTVEEEVLVTPRGPLIGPYLAGGAGSLSLRAVWLDSLPVRGLLCVHRARTFDEFRKNFAEWPFLPLNLAYADAAGNIGWQLAARPLAQGRRDGAAMGADPEAGWDGWCLFRPCPRGEPRGGVRGFRQQQTAGRWGRRLFERGLAGRLSHGPHLRGFGGAPGLGPGVHRPPANGFGIPAVAASAAKRDGRARFRSADQAGAGPSPGMGRQGRGGFPGGGGLRVFRLAHEPPRRGGQGPPQRPVGPGERLQPFVAFFRVGRAPGRAPGRAHDRTAAGLVPKILARGNRRGFGPGRRRSPEALRPGPDPVGVGPDSNAHLPQSSGLQGAFGRLVQPRPVSLGRGRLHRGPGFGRPS